MLEGLTACSVCGVDIALAQYKRSLSSKFMQPMCYTHHQEAIVKQITDLKQEMQERKDKIQQIKELERKMNG